MSTSSEPVLFADLLRRYRQAARLTQAELAEAAGMGVRGVSDLERGVRSAPRTATVAHLADALRLGESERAAFLLAARRQRARSTPASASVHLARTPTVSSLVGRVDELAHIERLLARGSPPVLLLAGEPGIGKTRLLQEATRRALTLGWRVLSGGCTRRSGQEVFVPIVGALARYVAGRTPAQQRHELTGCAWLVRLLPELAESAVVPAPTWTLAPEQERRLMFAAVRRFLANIAGPAGTLLALDDLQWAGADALDLLSSLARSAGAPPLCVIGGYRSTEALAGSAMAETLADLARDGLVERLALTALSSRDSATLLAHLTQAAGSEWSVELIAQVAQRTGGVPYFLVSCAQGLQRAPDDSLPAEMAGAIPWNVTESIRQRVAQLPEAAQQLLRLAAVAGREMESAQLLDLVARWGWQKADILAALEATCQARLLIEADEGQMYRFAHDLVREAVMGDLSGARRADLHLQIAEAVEQLPEPARERRMAELAWRFLQAGEAARALPCALQAGDQAEAVYALAEAEQHYGTAVEVAHEIGDQAREAEALEKLAAVLRFVTRYDEALALSERTATLYHTLGDAEGEGRALSLVCWTCWMQRLDPHQLDLVIARAERFLEDLRARGLSQLVQAQLHSRLGRLLIKRGAACEDGEAAVADMQRAVALTEQGIVLAEAGRHDETLARARATQANALLELGRLEEAVRAFEAVVPLAEAPGALVPAAVALASAQYLYLCQGEFKTSHDYIERALTLVERTGDIVSTVVIWVNRGRQAFYSGDWGRARAEFERAAAMVVSMPEGDVTLPFSPAPLELGLLCLAEGDWETSAAYLAEEWERAERWQDLRTLRVAAGPVAERDLLEGRPQAARERLAWLLDRAGMQEFQAQYVLPPLAWACLEVGEEERAQTLAAKSVARAVADGQRLFLVDALRVQALIAVRQGSWRKAEAKAKKSLALCRDMRYPYAEAKALYVYGRLHSAKGEPDLARKQYEQALTICDRLGERLYRTSIDRDLRRLAHKA
jgi:tetratricopeptide (TPR) repeat protein/transcriptional regulator with XRE-family HTH domain